MPVTITAVPKVVTRAMGEVIVDCDRRLLKQFSDRMVVDASLTRQMVSFQANKQRPAYRWYKYKEAFSASLMEHFYHRYQIIRGPVLDPFAGAGTVLFTASTMGLESEGIELLPIGQAIIAARLCFEREFQHGDFEALRRWRKTRPWVDAEARESLAELRITAGAYPAETRTAIERYLTACKQENDPVRRILLFALLCVLESVSYTRKDGQYLRWDYRSGRRQGAKQFDKGPILDFESAISAKLAEFLDDTPGGESQASLLPHEQLTGQIRLHEGSCLEILPALPSEGYRAVITSPPYCNRYDYTRTYALELALLGAGESDVTRLRQAMLSCTVENRAKDLVTLNPAWSEAVAAADRQDLLQLILEYLEREKAVGRLNNSGIPRMVRGYFYEMACVMAECARVLKPGSPLIMVNDNVRYAGASISVDLILSSLAEQMGFKVEQILVLPQGKGNSSQQMGEHGRESLRKCVYVWRKV